jgi:dTDP-4-dehydrorhamnose 3,5-epimerase-like enzyme
MLWIRWAALDFALSREAQVLYKTTDYYAPQHERTLAWVIRPENSMGTRRGVVSAKISRRRSSEADIRNIQEI